MDKALQRVTQLLNRNVPPGLRQCFERLRQMPGSNRIFDRVASASSREQLEDYLAEIRYALVCAGLGFEVEIEPCGRKGPDLNISRDGHSAVVEIMRFRKVHLGRSFDSPNEGNLLSEYGNPTRDIRKAFQKIETKFRQVKGEQAIIAIWNDDGDLDELEVEMAVNDLRDTANTVSHVLLFVLYGSAWWSAADQRQLYCFPFHDQMQPEHSEWIREFETGRLEEFIWCALTQHNEG